MSNIRVIKGDWYNADDYLNDLAPRNLAVEVIDGKIYDAELPGFPLAVDDDGSLRGWADAIFRPQEGELARIGVA